MRKLIYVPIIHTQTDMGTLSPRLEEEYIKKFSGDKWLKHRQTVEKLWTEIERRLNQLKTPIHKVYQDGLPICGRELELTTELANRGGRNHQIILQLVKQGAELLGTEDPKLLKEEYNTITKNLGQGESPREDYKKVVRENLEKRDRFIAQRINETLLPGETGVLFMGLLNQVHTKLAKDIRVEPLLNHFKNEKE